MGNGPGSNRSAAAARSAYGEQERSPAACQEQLPVSPRTYGSRTLQREEQRLSDTVARLNRCERVLKGYLGRNLEAGLLPDVFTFLVAPVYDLIEESVGIADMLSHLARQEPSLRVRRCSYHAMVEQLDQKVRALLRLEAAVISGDSRFVRDLLERQVKEE